MTDISDAEITRFTGDRHELRDLFRLAEDSERALDGYVDRGEVWVARDPAGALLGHLQLVVHDGVWEVLNTAVVTNRQGTGIGRRLLAYAIAEATAAGAPRLEVATAAADTGNLRFYQRCGLRLSRVVRDAFTPETGYDETIDIDGIPLRDQVWLDIDLTGRDRSPAR